MKTMRSTLAPSRVRRVAGSAVIAAVLSLVACASDTPTRYYTLEAIAPAGPVGSAVAATVAAPAGSPLEVRAVHIPPTLDRLELVHPLTQGEVAVRDFAHWAAPLGRMARQVLTEDLALRLPADQVVFPGAAGPELRAALTVDILSFKVADGSATMWVSWTLRPPVRSPSPAAPTAPSSAQASNPDGASLRLTAPAGDSDASMAKAFSVLLGQLADDIAKRVTLQR